MSDVEITILEVLADDPDEWRTSLFIARGIGSTRLSVAASCKRLGAKGLVEIEYRRAVTEYRITEKGLAALKALEEETC